jgi:hypothetical protein
VEENITKLAQLLEIGGACCLAGTDHLDPITTFRLPATTRADER